MSTSNTCTANTLGTGGYIFARTRRGYVTITRWNTGLKQDGMQDTDRLPLQSSNHETRFVTFVRPSWTRNHDRTVHELAPVGLLGPKPEDSGFALLSYFEHQKHPRSWGRQCTS